MKTVENLISELEIAHIRALRSLDAYHRSGAGTRTAKSHFERYERNSDKFSTVLRELKERFQKGQQ